MKTPLDDDRTRMQQNKFCARVGLTLLIVKMKIMTLCRYIRLINCTVVVSIKN